MKNQLRIVVGWLLERVERLLSDLCQRRSVIGRRPLRHRAAVLFQLARQTGRSGRRRTARLLGEPSCFQEGDWVRILDADGIRATLDATSRCRGLVFVRWQWPYCSGVYQVEKVVRRLIDDRGVFRPVSRTVLLTGVDCGGPSGAEGCGRRCPLLFRDEWLRSAPPPGQTTLIISGDVRFIRVRPLEEIRATLDRHNKHDGLLFMPEMARWAGQRLPLARRSDRLYELDGTAYAGYVTTRSPVYILKGAFCSGAVLGCTGPCHRRCPILWHQDWLIDDADLSYNASVAYDKRKDPLLLERWQGQRPGSV